MHGEIMSFAHELLDARAFEDAALALFQREVGCEVAFFSVKGAEAEPAVLGLERELIARAVAGGENYARELLPVKHAALAGTS